MLLEMNPAMWNSCSILACNRVGMQRCADAQRRVPPWEAKITAPLHSQSESALGQALSKWNHLLCVRHQVRSSWTSRGPSTSISIFLWGTQGIWDRCLVYGPSAGKGVRKDFIAWLQNALPLDLEDDFEARLPSQISQCMFSVFHLL